MNPRVSRSSALASKATGFPIAKIAAKLAVGYTLDELANDITRVTPASFEPTIDYVVVKIPRFTFEKFPGTPALLTTIDEVGRRGDGDRPQLRRGAAEGPAQHGDRAVRPRRDRAARATAARDAFRAALSAPRPDRLLMAAQALRAGLSVEDIHDACKFDPWFLRELDAHRRCRARRRRDGLPREAGALRRLKALGFSDRRLAQLAGARPRPTVAALRARARRACRSTSASTPAPPSSPPPRRTCIRPTKAATARRSARPTRPTARKIIILGGGPNRIGQGIEFDYCCVHAAYALREAGFETIMVNCNPETVSTDYDTSDRLYFEPLTAEDVIALVRREQQRGTVLGCIVQYGGQTPLKLSQALARGRHPDPRHQRRRDRHRRGPRALPAAAAHGSACASRTTASRARPRKPRRSPSASAIRW